MLNHHEIKISYTGQTNLRKNENIVACSKLGERNIMEDLVFLQKKPGAKGNLLSNHMGGADAEGIIDQPALLVAW
jgi:hypothetical protein